jgi:hypothetical protein
MKNNLPDHIVTESRNLLEKRLATKSPRSSISVYRQKTTPRRLIPPISAAARSRVSSRCTDASGLKITPEFQAVIKFMNDFDAKGKALVSACAIRSTK